MKKYDYKETVKKDVMDWTREHLNLTRVKTADALKKYILAETRENDYVTGGESGCYRRPYMDCQEKEQIIGQNLDLLIAAILNLQEKYPDEAQEFLEFFRDNDNDPHTLDAMIRCYLLPDAIDQIVTELLPEIEKSQESAS